jgi:hypothetical protein
MCLQQQPLTTPVLVDLAVVELAAAVVDATVQQVLILEPQAEQQAQVAVQAVEVVVGD